MVVASGRGNALAPVPQLYSWSTGNNPADLGKLEPEFLHETADVDIRGREEPARVVPLPFYRRETKGSRP